MQLYKEQDNFFAVSAEITDGKHLADIWNKIDQLEANLTEAETKSAAVLENLVKKDKMYQQVSCFGSSGRVAVS